MILPKWQEVLHEDYLTFDNMDISTFQKIDVASLCDADKSLKVLSPELKPFSKGRKFAGFARTVKANDDFLAVMQTLQKSLPNEVLVVDGGGSEIAILGELFSNEAMRKGLSAIIVDGAIRDTSSLKELSMPIYARYASPMAGTTQKLFENKKTLIAKTPVSDGELILGDEDGIVVLTPEKFEELCPIALLIQEKETEILRKIKNGESLFDYVNLEEHLVNLKEGKKSKFSFK